MRSLVLGPVRSGKSARAASLARSCGKSVIFAATAAVDPADEEMAERVARHRADRPASWRVVETAAPAGPSLVALLREAGPHECVIIDALGTWIAAIMFDLERATADGSVTNPAALERAGNELADAVAAARADVVIVAEEVGWGVVPASAQGRVFRDTLGRLVQRIARVVDRVELVVAGYAVDLRAIGHPLEGETREL
ncbi:MAG: adenosylcobinamide-phosphate guanylyltransferase [Candidatus Eremiobacteraeota bacterium]|nr:adenosylcobinamide-phosphate guanylyltransferase [Candidatus Eremiobacteraeota bacterium]